MVNYREYIISPEWRKFCAKIILERRSCEACNSARNFNVHHKTYKNLGEEKPEDVALLCRSCHELLHDYHLVKGGSLFKASNRFIREKQNGTFKMPKKEEVKVIPSSPQSEYLLRQWKKKKPTKKKGKKRRFFEHLKESIQIQKREKELALLRAEAKKQHL